MSEEIVRCARCKRILTGKAAKYWGMGGVCRAKAPGMAARIQAEKAGQLPLSLKHEGDALVFEVARNGQDPIDEIRTAVRNDIASAIGMPSAEMMLPKTATEVASQNRKREKPL